MAIVVKYIRLYRQAQRLESISSRRALEIPLGSNRSPASPGQTNGSIPLMSWSNGNERAPAVPFRDLWALGRLRFFLLAAKQTRQLINGVRGAATPCSTCQALCQVGCAAGAAQLRLQQAGRSTTNVWGKLGICGGTVNLEGHLDSAALTVGPSPEHLPNHACSGRRGRCRNDGTIYRRDHVEVHVVLGIQSPSANHRAEARHHQIEVVGPYSRRRHVNVAGHLLNH